jgi:hypothetical protein
MKRSGAVEHVLQDRQARYNPRACVTVERHDKEKPANSEINGRDTQDIKLA